MVMLHGIHRSLLHAGGSSCNPSRYRTLIAANTKGKTLTGVSRQCWKRQPEPQQLLPSRLSTQLMSSMSSSSARSKGSPVNSMGQGLGQQLVAPHGELPPNLKLAEEVMERLRTIDEREEQISNQDIDGDKDEGGNGEGQSGSLEDASLTLPEEGSGRAASTEVKVVSWSDGTNVSTRSLDPQVFGVHVRRDVVHEVIRWQLARRRAGNAKTKRIGEISGSGRKVRPQKGQGIARAGHSRPPHWRGGAKAHGPRIRDWSYKLNKKYLKLGLRAALSARLQEGKLKVVDELKSDAFSTSDMLKSFEAMGLGKSVLFIDQEIPAPEFLKSTGNIVGVKVVPSRGANVYDIIKREELVITEGGVSSLEEMLKPQ